MRPEERDAAYLWDIEAAQGVLELTKGLSYQDYMANRTVQLAVEREVEIIGEAARRVSDAYRMAHAGIPWKKIISQRHVLAHEYGAIQQDRMWQLATRHIPDLVAQLKPLIPPLPRED